MVVVVVGVGGGGWVVGGVGIFARDISRDRNRQDRQKTEAAHAGNQQPPQIDYTAQVRVVMMMMVVGEWVRG